MRAQTPASQIVAAEPMRYALMSGQVAPMEVAVETPVNIVYGTLPYAVMMASPSDLEDFVAGFSLTEGIVQDISDIRSIVVTQEQRGITVSVDLIATRLRDHLTRRRNLSGRTSCGLCGIAALADLPEATRVRGERMPFAPSSIAAALAALEQHQPLNRLTRAVHAAAWCDHEGRINCVREDVGRHNALDKLIGARLRAGLSADDGFVLITSRASFEMIEKVAIYGASTLVAISAPTSLAVERATVLGLTLVAVARGDSALLFNGALAIKPETV